MHGPLNDSDPYPKNIVNAPNLSALLQTKYGASGSSRTKRTSTLSPTAGRSMSPARTR